jgi:carbamate kinase
MSGLSPSNARHADEPLAIVCLAGDPTLMGTVDGDPRETQRAAQRSAKAIATLVREGFRLVIVPAGGAAIDRELIRNEETSTKLPPSTMSEAAAAAQGAVGVRLEAAVRNALRQEGLDRDVATLVTPILVSTDDPAFETPTRPVGPLLSAWRAKEIARTRSVHLVEEAGRGWRRVVALPVPVECLGLPAAEALVEAGHIVLTAAGGGVPVTIDTRAQLSDTEALLDEVQVATLLANELAASVLILMHATEHLASHAGLVQQANVEQVTRHQLRALADAGAFADHATSVTVDASLDFLDAGGELVIVTAAQKLTAALAGRAGTRVTREVVSEDTQQISLFGAQGAQERDQQDSPLTTEGPA